MNIEEIANKCHTRIAANNGFFRKEYFISCIVDAIREAIASQQSVYLTALRRGLALSILFNVILLAVVLFTIGGR